jgi:molybdopterin synthase sulfur carrier subunit
MTITVKLFAAYRELLGKSEVSLTLRPGMTVADVFHETVGDKGSDGLRKSTLFAVNEAYVLPDTVVKDGDRVAFIPPVSGG